jgi:S1-C subfamily serine protease
VAVYPRGATIVEGVTAAIVQREWVTEVEREAAAVALKRLMDPEVQRKIMARGFRPAQAGAALAAPLDKAWGVNPQAAAERTGMPPVDLALDCQDAWRKACEVPIRPIGGTDEAVRTVDPAAVRKAAATAGKASRLTPLILCVRKAKPTTVFITRPAIRKVIGSGVVVDPRGYVVTNSHVVGEAKEVTIRFLDGAEKTVEAEVVYNEPKEDLALVRIRTAGEYAAVAYSDSDGVEVGEQVVAIGNPYGYTGTVSLGIVSAVGREIPMPDGGSLTQLIQTDASLNPGNSGGPLLNIDGDLIGINVAVRENAQNIGFAIPANRVRQIVAKILAK